MYLIKIFFKLCFKIGTTMLGGGEHKVLGKKMFFNRIAEWTLNGSFNLRLHSDVAIVTCSQTYVKSCTVMYALFVYDSMVSL